MHENSPHNVPPSPEVPRPPSGHAVPALRKKKAKQRLIVLAVAVVVIGGAYWYFQKSLSLPLEKIASSVSSLETAVSGASSSSPQNFSAPGPLVQVSKTSAKKANTLTIDGVVTNTNDQRAENGNLPPLAENDTLDDIATLRIDDLFQQQYFAHVGPQGESAETVASTVGYTYIALGENLALGNYAGDAGVVTAWMNSPGHRANILDTHYTEIGVAVREGMFQGQNTWLAVQVFGRPASDCPAPDPTLKGNIDNSQAQITTMAAQLQTDKAAIAAMNPPSGPQYNEQVEDYNNLAAQYNTLTSQTTAAIAAYNAQNRSVQ